MMPLQQRGRYVHLTPEVTRMNAVQIEKRKLPRAWNQYVTQYASESNGLGDRTVSDDVLDKSKASSSRSS